jgi:hypothetical protein
MVACYVADDLFHSVPLGNAGRAILDKSHVLDSREATLTNYLLAPTRTQAKTLG